jgi:aminoethylphosphonate catabolism LysR family transcriptional regulator
MRHVQLRAFHQVALSGGFSRAGEALSLTQPAISDQVRKLEDEYDVVLFDRSHKQVTLTARGAQLFEITRRLFAVEAQAQELLTETQALRSGALRLIADSAHHVLHILGPFTRAYPKVAVSVRTGNSEEVLARLRDYEADIGVLGAAPAGRGFVTVKLGASPLIAFAAATHPLARRRTITLAELASHPLVLREPGSKTREGFEAEARTRGLTLRATMEAEGREAVRELVAAGAGIGIVSEAEFGRDPRLRPIQISDCRIVMEESLICLRERRNSRLINAFLDIALK